MSRARPRFRQLPLGARLAAVALVAGTVWLALRGRREPVTSFELRAAPEFWSENGYVEMALPNANAALEENGPRVTVWLHLPAAGQFTLSAASTAERPLLHGPDGTNVVRVEAQHGYVTGVCGMQLGPTTNARQFVMQPASTINRTALRGYSWPRDDQAAQARARDLMVTYAGAPPSPTAHSGNSTPCSQCHTAQATATAHANDARALSADADGLFTIQRVLGPPAGNERPAKASCDARRYLFTHFAPIARAAFRDAFRACAIGE